MNRKAGRRFPWKWSHTDPFGGALAAAAATGEHWRGNRAWCAVCGDPIRAHPKSKKPFRALPTPSAAAMLGQECIYCCRANKPALICPNGFELVPSGFFLCESMRVFQRACLLARARCVSLAVSGETAFLSCVGFLQSLAHTLKKVQSCKDPFSLQTAIYFSL